MRFFSRQAQQNFSVAYIDILNVSWLKNRKYSCRNGRKNYGFIYVTHGSMRYDFLGEIPETLCINAGTLLYIPKNCAYSVIYLEDNTAHKNIQFDLISGSLPEYLSAPKVIPIANAKDIVEAFFRQQDSHLFYRLSCLYQLLWHVENCCSGLPVKYKRIFPALTAMSECRAFSAPISYYAELCEMSEVNFRRIFKEYTGKTPVEYRNDLRLEDAKSRIESGEYNVSEAAEASGFVNLSFFSRLYKKKYGHTPKQT